MLPYSLVSAIPNHGRLALHGDGLAGVECLQNRDRFGHRKRSDDAPVFGLDPRDGAGDEVVGTHGISLL